MSNNDNDPSIQKCPWICDDIKEEYSPWNLVLELVVIIPAFILGIYGLYFLPGFGLILSILYAAWCFGCYFVIFRIILCPNCYYYGKWCPDGMGKYAKKVFNVKGDINNYKKALTIPTIGWAVIILFPIIILTIFFFFLPRWGIPIYIGFDIVYIPLLLYAIVITANFFLYFMIHQRFSCRGCAHVEHCNLSLVPLPYLFLIGIIILSLIELVYLFFFCKCIF